MESTREPIGRREARVVCDLRSGARSSLKRTPDYGLGQRITDMHYDWYVT
jgi:hypothetical protein